ncbi:MAG: hypothetical protein ACJ8EH_01040 [Sphingomicrobium sp.]
MGERRIIPCILACAALLFASVVPIEMPMASAVRFVVVPTTQGGDCVDLDSRWGLGSLLAWRQTICGSTQDPVWVQTDCSQDFARDGYWIATSTDGRDFTRKAKYNADEYGSSIAQFVCFTVGRQ